MSQPVGFIRDLIEHGLQLLGAGLTQYPEFNPGGKYDEKNDYFAAANNLGLRYLREPGQEWIAEMYFQAMLDNILSYEEQSGKRVNKGMVYANLGISGIRNGRLDDGIANFFAAEYEDRQCKGLEKWDIANTTLWWQFEILVVTFISSFVGKEVISEFDSNELFGKQKLFKEMERQDRVFFDGTVLAIRKNWEIFQRVEARKVEQNAYTLGQLYSGLRDLCLSVDSLLRHKQEKRGLIGLNELLKKALEHNDIGYPQSGISVNVTDLREFLEHLEQIIQKVDNPKLRGIYCLHLSRNFTIHCFEMTERLFFEKYELVLANIFAAILYLKSVGAI